MTNLKRVLLPLFILIAAISMLASCNIYASPNPESSESNTMQSQESISDSLEDSADSESHTHRPSKSVVENLIESTCTEEGSYDEVIYCSVCQKELVRIQKTIKMKDHEYTQRVTTDDFLKKEATCTDSALYYYSCICGKTDSAVFRHGSPIPHTFDQENTDEAYFSEPATETEGTKYFYSCTCGAVGTTTFISGDPLGHTHIFDLAVPTSDYLKDEATCTTQATYYYSCRCGEAGTEAFNYGEVLDHSPDSPKEENRIEPTCSKYGSYDEVIYCESCDAELNRKSNSIEKLPHTEVIDDAVDPTCTVMGISEGKHCGVCDEVIVAQKVIPALGHTKVTDEAKAPTCKNTGLTEGSHCETCGEVFIAQTTVDALGHDKIYHEGKEPTCTEYGWNAYYTCSRCSYSTFSKLYSTGHDYDGRYCSSCGDEYSTKGLYFALNEDGESYTLTDGKYAWDSFVYIPSYYNGLPVTHIGNNAFDSCDITGVDIPSTVTHIGNDAFNSCDITGVNIPSTVTHIGEYAFYGNYNITNLTVGAEFIGNSAFSGCENISTLTILDTVKTIDDYAFSFCHGLTSVVVPDSVTTVGNKVFYYCDNLSSLTLPFLDRPLGDIVGYSEYEYEYNEEYDYYESNYYVSAKLQTLIITGGDSIPENAFDKCKYLKNLTLPNSISIIKPGTLAPCINLECLSVPFTGVGEVNTTDYDADNYYGMDFEFMVGGYRYSIAILFGCTMYDSEYMPLPSPIIGPVPTTLTAIKITGTDALNECAFYGCTSLTEVYILGEVEQIDYYTFSNLDSNDITIYCSLPEKPYAWPYYWNNDFPVVWAYGHTYSDWIVKTEPTCLANGERVRECTECKMVLESETIEKLSHTEVWVVDTPNGCYEDGQKHKECSVCKTVLQTATIYSAHDFVDGYCTVCNAKFYTNGLSFSLNSDLESYSVSGKGRYTGTDIVIPDTYKGLPVTAISANAFESVKVSSLVIGNNVKTIGDYAFDSSGISSIEWGTSVKSIGSWAFNWCRFESLYLPDSVEYLGYNCFADNRSLTSVSVGENIKSMESGTFGWCFSLRSFTYRGTVAQWKALGISDWFAKETALYYIYCSNGSVEFSDPGDGAD